jgi:hypothetical protein
MVFSASIALAGCWTVALVQLISDHEHTMKKLMVIVSIVLLQQRISPLVYKQTGTVCSHDLERLA